MNSMDYMKFMLTYILQAKRTYFIVFLLLILESVSNYSIIFIQKIIIDDIFYSGKYGLLPAVIVVFAVAGIVHALMFTMTSRYLVTSEFTISQALLRRLLSTFEKVPVARFQKDRHGKYVHTLTVELFSAASFMGWILPRGIQELFNLVILIGIIGWASPLLLVMVLVMCAFYIAIGYYYMPRLKAAANEVSERRTALLIHIEEGVSSTREVVAYHRMKWETAIFNKMFKRYFEKVIDEGELVNRQMRFSDPMKWGINILVLGFGGYQLMNGSMSIGTFVIVFQFASQMSDSCYNLFQYMMGASGYFAHMERVNRIIEMDNPETTGRSIQGSIQSISFEQVRFQYDEELPEVLRGFNAELPVGKKIAIVGTSGGGKSTIGQLLVRFYDPQIGTIRINGIPLSDIPRGEWSNRMSIVFQDPYMFPDTIRENILLGRSHVTVEQMHEACTIAQIHDFIQGLPDGYDTDIGERGIKLSGGQRQRIAIARAVIGDPEILVLDETTSALDLETERLLLNNLDERRKGLTTIVIAHRLSTVENADLILVLDKGTLADSGRHDELLVAPKSVYRELLRASAEH
jgi:ABC-type bacteriocin/lantibiotic exporter with double-glycine peptidase domain